MFLSLFMYDYSYRFHGAVLFFWKEKSSREAGSSNCINKLGKTKETTFLPVDIAGFDSGCTGQTSPHSIPCYSAGAE